MKWRVEVTTIDDNPVAYLAGATFPTEQDAQRYCREMETYNTKQHMRRYRVIDEEEYKKLMQK